MHRIDRHASGLLVFARTPEAYASLKRQFYDHTITRRYDVVVAREPDPKRGHLQHRLTEDATGRVNVVWNTRHKLSAKDVKEASLDYEVIKSVGGRTHVRCTLHTGRKHQIRVQLNAIGHPVLGDPVYGSPEAHEGKEWPGRLALHASHLAFDHPRTGERVAFNSPMPPNFALTRTKPVDAEPAEAPAAPLPLDDADDIAPAAPGEKPGRGMKLYRPRRQPKDASDEA